jgi:hypothetical protein
MSKKSSSSSTAVEVLTPEDFNVDGRVLNDWLE